MLDNEFLFTSESVTEGHPDKVADQISDGVLDAVLAGLTGRKIIVGAGLADRAEVQLAYGHFGREEPDFTWEVTDKAQALRYAAGLGATVGA